MPGSPGKAGVQDRASPLGRSAAAVVGRRSLERLGVALLMSDCVSPGRGKFSAMFAVLLRTGCWQMRFAVRGAGGSDVVGRMLCFHWLKVLGENS